MVANSVFQTFRVKNFRKKAQHPGIDSELQGTVQDIPFGGRDRPDVLYTAICSVPTLPFIFQSVGSFSDDLGSEITIHISVRNFRCVG